jgi:NADH-quinone oxidoreductase subunit E
MGEQLDAILSSYSGRGDELIPILLQVQREFGYLPEQGMLDVARFTGVPESKVYGVASFYAQFRLTPVGRKHIRVCRGTACYVKGAQGILKEIAQTLGIMEGETTPDGEFSLETVACIGSCSLAPCVMINNGVEAQMSPKKVAQLFEKGTEE